ncbi:MAG TPA: sodium/substrate symporter small subunit [Burkholderiaceae bacterium]|nr:sodium/substrate symporter small subunit [Burkholderiaceae bacterium]
MQPTPTSAEPVPSDRVPQGEDDEQLDARLWQRRMRVTAALLGLWLLATFGVAYFARELSIVVWGWPLSFWVAAQGALLVYMALVVAYAVRMGRIDDERDATTAGRR